MKAEEARAITQESLKGPVIERFIEVVNKRISAAAKKGKRSIRDPHIGKPEDGFEFWLGGDEQTALRNYFQQKGFIWKDVPDPDPGHPCSSSYVELSW